jgi:hypothetical protein
MILIKYQSLKHHCRICLKIFCYYCCNNWIEYNNSKLRVCNKCFETKENLSKLKSEQTTIEAIKAASVRQNLKIEELKVNDDGEDKDNDDDSDVNFEVRAEKLITSPNSNYPNSSKDNFDSSIYDSKASSSTSDLIINNQFKSNETSK